MYSDMRSRRIYVSEAMPTRCSVTTFVNNRRDLAVHTDKIYSLHLADGVRQIYRATLSTIVLAGGVLISKEFSEDTHDGFMVLTVKAKLRGRTVKYFTAIQAKGAKR